VGVLSGRSLLALDHDIMKTVWITGASSGIGEALAKEYALAGFQLILSARRQDKLEQLKNNLHDSEKHLIVPLDVSKTDEIPAIVHATLEKIEQLDILINNAGISQRARAVDTSLEIDRQIFEVNFFGSVAMTRALLPALKRSAGAIMVISSVTGKVQTPSRTAYCASKHALHGWFDALRCEVWRDEIDVMLVTPGFIRTELSYAALEADGTPRGKMDKNQEKGMSANQAAKKIMAAQQRGVEEFYVGGIRERGALWIKRFFPRIFSSMAKKFPEA